jgi:hypothetical protein
MHSGAEATGRAIAYEKRSLTRRLEEGTGRAPLIGASRGFWDGTLGGPTSLSADSLWVFNFATTCPDLPSEWSTWAFWMSSGTATVPGISVQADVDEFNGSSGALSALASPSAAPAMESGWTALLGAMLLLAGASVTVSSGGRRGARSRLRTSLPR